MANNIFVKIRKKPVREPSTPVFKNTEKENEPVKSDELSSNRCFMCDTKHGACKGGILNFPLNCGKGKCAFYKTAAQQHAQEEAVVRHLKADFIPIAQDYKSRVDGFVLLDKDEHNRYCVIHGARGRV